MEISISQPSLLAALNVAQSVADRKGSASQPILANVLLRAAKDGNLIVSASDLHISTTESVSAEVVKTGAITLGAKYLHSVVKTLPSSETLNLVALDNHWLAVRYGKRSEFKIMGQSPVDFPDLPTLPKGQAMSAVDAYALADLIDKTAFSISTDDARVNLNGVLLESDGKTATMVSTDGHRLTKLSLDLAGGPIFSTPVIIPRKGIMEIKRVLDRIKGQVSIAVEGQHIYVQTETLTLAVRLNNVVFPPYAQVIPKQDLSGKTKRVTADRVELLDILRRAEVMAPEKTATVRLQLAGQTLTITADNPDLGVAQQEIDVEYAGSNLMCGFNAHYMIEVIEACESTRVFLDFDGELDPCVIRPDEGQDYLGVVMPMRI